MKKEDFYVFVVGLVMVFGTFGFLLFLAAYGK